MKSNVVFLINSLSSGGAEKVLSILASELLRQDYQVEVIFLEKNILVSFYLLLMLKLKRDGEDQKIYMIRIENFLMKMI